MTVIRSRSSAGVIHLVRVANGPSPFRAFLESLRTHDAGRDYELVLLLKGFRGDELPSAYEDLIGALPHKRLFLPDVGFDIGAYFFAARRTTYDKLCFFNSFSRILHPGWLQSFDEALARPRVGIVGATGSAETTRAFGSPRGHLGSVLRMMSPKYWYRTIAFPPFPNYHLRSNAFCLSRADFLSLSTSLLRTKRDLYRFESGRWSMTRRLAARGLEARVVGRDGVAYRPSEWATSGTFRSGDQENLLVADNRTADYSAADTERRRVLAEAAWGDLSGSRNPLPF